MSLGTQVKYYLYNHVEQIISILDFLGCHDITESTNEIRCAVPDGDNATSVCIFLNEFLGTKVYTRPGYQGRDIIDLVQYLRHLKTATEAITWILAYCGIEKNDEEIAVYPSEKFLAELKRCSLDTADDESIEEIPADYMLQFEDQQSPEWEAEGISVETQKRFGVRYDPQRKRYVFPIYDNKGKIVNIRGRTTIPNYKELNIPKYLPYFKGRGMVLYGEYEHKQDIQDAKSVIVFEGEKSVMLAEEYGYYNTVAVGTCSISEKLTRRLLRLRVDVILAFDKGISFSHVYKEAKKLSQFTNVYVVYDTDNLLNPKDAPVDRGWLVWDTLYESRKRIN
jgi:DNA primase